MFMLLLKYVFKKVRFCFVFYFYGGVSVYNFQYCYYFRVFFRIDINIWIIVFVLYNRFCELKKKMKKIKLF